MLTLERPDMAYWKTERLLRMRWPDGTKGYCKACDASTPMSAQGGMLACPSGHLTHPVTVIVSKGYEE